MQKDKQIEEPFDWNCEIDGLFIESVIVNIDQDLEELDKSLKERGLV